MDASLIRRLFDPVRRDGVRLSHAPEELTVRPGPEAKDVRVFALREPEPRRNALRAPSAVRQPVERDGENRSRAVLAGVERDQLFEKPLRERKLRQTPLAPRELAQRGDDHPETQTVPIQKRVENPEKVSFAPSGGLPDRVPEAEAVPGGIEPFDASGSRAAHDLTKEPRPSEKKRGERPLLEAGG